MCCYHNTISQVALKLIFFKIYAKKKPSPFAQVVLEVQKQMTSLDSEVKETRKATEELQQAAGQNGDVKCLLQDWLEKY